MEEEQKRLRYFEKKFNWYLLEIAELNSLNKKFKRVGDLLFKEQNCKNDLLKEAKEKWIDHKESIDELGRENTKDLAWKSLEKAWNQTKKVSRIESLYKTLKEEYRNRVGFTGNFSFDDALFNSFEERRKWKEEQQELWNNEYSMK